MSDLAEIFRREAGRCTATLIRVLGDIDLAEDAVAEAFAVAAERWPTEGVPPNPGGWITTTARNRAIDRLRRESTRTDRHLAALRLEADDMEPDTNPELHDLDGFVDVVADDQLRLMFLCCHPALAADAQVALTLRLLGGLDTPEIARAFLVPEPTLAQRIVRAKRKLRDNHAPYRIPRHAALPDRLHAVLAAIYLIYTEGHTATTGDSLTRVDLSREAIRLGRVLTELMPDEPEAVGLLALMLLTEARRPARTAADGSMICLADQERSRWDRMLITEGHTLVRACLRRDQPGPFQIQAAIAAVHADAATAAATEWSQIVALYDQLHALRPNAVVALNRAAAIGQLHGAVAGLDALDSLDVTQLEDYQPYHAAHADLLARAGRRDAALAAYDRAIELTANPTERRFLERQRTAAADELLTVFNQHQDCLARNSWVGDIGCEALYYRNVGFAIGRLGANIAGDIVAGIANLLSTADWANDAAGDAIRIMNGNVTIGLAAAPPAASPPAASPPPAPAPAPTPAPPQATPPPPAPPSAPQISNFNAYSNGPRSVGVTFSNYWPNGAEPVICHYLRDGVEIHTVQCGVSPSITVTDQPSGQHRYAAYVTDIRGASSNTLSADVAVEEPAPSAPQISNFNAYSNGPRSVRVTFNNYWPNGAEPVICHYLRDGVEIHTVQCGVSPSITFTNQPSGQHRYAAYVTDIRGASSNTLSADVGVQ